MNNKSENIEALELHLSYSFEEHVNFKERIIRLNSEINEEAFDLIDSGLTEMESHSRQPITIRLCSEGGDIVPAMAIVGRIKQSKCKIIIEGYGYVASAATIVFAAGKERKISKYAQFMHHESAYIVEGRHTEVMAEVVQKQKEEHLWAEIMAEFSKKPKDFYLEEGKHTDKYWTPQQLVKFGIADEII